MQILTIIRIICLFFLSFFFRRCRETEVRICCHLDRVDVMYQMRFNLNTKFLLKLMKNFSFLYISVCFFSCRTYEDERGVSDVSYSEDIDVMLLWPEIM